jgi:hypothetical protein
MGDFYSREGLQVHLWAKGLDPCQHVPVIGKGEIGMNATDNMNFADRFLDPFPNFGLDVFQTHFIGQGVGGVFAKGAKTAAIGTDVGIIDMLVDDEIGLVAVF